ncbi:nucleoside deaminase [Siminovitchia sediminis]|uniref:Nucleoside deaminase n=1 Tax=Siminovitchia sediminis TaxID=1274353 RepID=A0ABW4KG36_9BACI
MDAFMKRAVELANESVKDGGQPFGAVLVKDGKIISEGINELHKKYDISGHAELIAIRKAQEQLQTLDLSGCTMYASGEPCPMCMTAIYFSGIQKVYYCGSVEDAQDAGLGKSVYVYSQLALPRNQRDIDMEQMPLIEGMSNPLKNWKDREPK